MSYITIEQLKDIERRIQEGRHYTERDLLLLIKEIESLQNEVSCLKDELFKLRK